MMKLARILCLLVGGFFILATFFGVVGLTENDPEGSGVAYMTGKVFGVAILLLIALLFFRIAARIKKRVERKQASEFVNDLLSEEPLQKAEKQSTSHAFVP